MRSSKTQAGIRLVRLVPLLRRQLLTHREAAGSVNPEGHVFANGNGRPRDKDNLRSRVLGPVIAETDETLARLGHPPLAPGITPHKLRHTFASILVACGEDPASVMAQLGHTDPRFTLRVYAHPMPLGEGERRRLKELIYGGDRRS